MSCHVTYALFGVLCVRMVIGPESCRPAQQPPLLHFINVRMHKIRGKNAHTLTTKKCEKVLNKKCVTQMRNKAEKMQTNNVRLSACAHFKVRSSPAKHSQAYLYMAIFTRHICGCIFMYVAAAQQRTQHKFTEIKAVRKLYAHELGTLACCWR